MVAQFREPQRSAPATARTEARARLLEAGLRQAAERVRYRRELLVALATEERRLRDETSVLEDTLRSLEADPAGVLGEDRAELGRVAVRAYIEKRKEVARLRAHMREIGEALDELEPELARRQAAYAEFRRRAGHEGSGGDTRPASQELELLRCEPAESGLR
jgi:hypothetical protein